jgi:tRNA-(ms[2]io[6]A)-hydroxylase
VFCLCQPTHPSWVAVAVSNLDALLADHAHCEVKAATTALSLALKNHADLDVVLTLSRLAQEEVDHFARVVAFMKRRGVVLGQPPTDDYATRLRKSIGQLGPCPYDPLVDRMLVGALIEARSCERFKLLLDAWPDTDDSADSVELRDFYRELFECEAKHYTQYRSLAVQVAKMPASVVDVRLARLAALEGQIIVDLGAHLPSPSVHG